MVKTVNETLKELLGGQTTLKAIERRAEDTDKFKFFFAILNSRKDMAVPAACIIHRFAFGFSYRFQVFGQGRGYKHLFIPEELVPLMQLHTDLAVLRPPVVPHSNPLQCELPFHFHGNHGEEVCFNVQAYGEEVELRTRNDVQLDVCKYSYISNGNRAIPVKSTDLTSTFIRNFDDFYLPGHIPLISELNFVDDTRIKRNTVTMEFLMVRVDDDEYTTRVLYVGPIDRKYWSDSELDILMDKIDARTVLFVSGQTSTTGEVARESPFVKTSAVPDPKWEAFEPEDIEYPSILGGDFKLRLSENVHFFRWSKM
jgi:hypothetical protein